MFYSILSVNHVTRNVKTVKTTEFFTQSLTSVFLSVYLFSCIVISIVMLKNKKNNSTNFRVKIATQDQKLLFKTNNDNRLIKIC